MSDSDRHDEDLGADLRGVPLDALLAELAEGRRALAAADVEQLAARPDLAGSAERLALLDRAASSMPGGALRVADEALVRWLLESLTKDRFQKAQAVFKRIWAGGGAPSLSELAQRGLDKMGERTARQAKELDKALAQAALRWDPHHPSPLAAAIAGLFDLAPATAFDRLGHLLSAERVATETGAQLAKDLVAYVAHRSADVSADARWLRALATLSRDARLKVAIKQALGAFDPALVRAAMEGAVAAPKSSAASSSAASSSAASSSAASSSAASSSAASSSAAPRAPVPSTIDYLARYLAGEHEAVWSELFALGETVRDPAVLQAANAVARETMRRVREDVEAITERLRKHGYKLRNAKKALAAPAALTAKHLDALEKIAGHPLPLSLRAFWEAVGSIDLTEHQGRAYRENELLFEGLGQDDPLVICPPKDALDFAKAWQKERSATLAELLEPLALYVGPGRVWKGSPEAGDDAPCWMKLTGATADALVGPSRGPHEPFVATLRRVILTCGGFAGLAGPRDDAEWPGLALLTADLQPF
jgi:hypothetical protein